MPPTKLNFLLGYGERLVEPIPPPRLKPSKSHPYTFQESKKRLLPLVTEAAGILRALPRRACPFNHSVIVMTLHPEYIAKSYYPSDLLDAIGFAQVGSKPRKLKPQKVTRKKSQEAETTEIFLAGNRDNLDRWAGSLSTWTMLTQGADDLIEIEAVRAPSPDERIKPITSTGERLILEVVLHANLDSEGIVESFRDYARSLDAVPDMDRRLYAGGLCFIPMLVNRGALREIALFSFLRVAREMPHLRPLTPAFRAFTPSRSFTVTYPNSSPVANDLRAAVFDGGIGRYPELAQWINPVDVPGIGESVAEYEAHGLAVTSALLFGSLKDGGTPVPVPYGIADHYRVLDKKSDDDPYELYDALRAITGVLDSRHYEFINLSIGPSLPIEDDEVHAWTAVLDQYLATGNTLATVAVGNSGENDRASGNARVQVPADCVNALAVGAADSRGDQWIRASYSSVGPGRRPGIVKPDLLAFGGSAAEPFWVPESGHIIQTIPNAGTSFSAPSVLRTAMGVRAHFGARLGPLAIRCLLVHVAGAAVSNRIEHGWGRAPQELEELVVCEDGSARIVYQGVVTAAQYLRAPIPVPDGTVGRLEVRATLCFLSDTDPQDPSNYTRSALEVVFRPNAEDREPRGANAKSKPFFATGERYTPEGQLRVLDRKWEPILHMSKRFNPGTLKNPTFDIHHNARIGGGPSSLRTRIPYALVVTVTSAKTPDLYDRVVRRYPGILEILRPVIQIPVRSRS
jgi:hypothetical protein